MRAGRIEAYLHSDSATPNKGGALAEVLCATDFGARTDGFVAFAKKAARFAFAAKARTWKDVVESFPEIEAERVALSRLLKEPVDVARIARLALDEEVPAQG